MRIAMNTLITKWTEAGWAFLYHDPLNRSWAATHESRRRAYIEEHSDDPARTFKDWRSGGWRSITLVFAFTGYSIGLLALVKLVFP